MVTINCLKELLYVVLAQKEVVQSPPPDIHNDTFSPFTNEVRTLSEQLVDVVDLISVQLEHCPWI